MVHWYQWYDWYQWKSILFQWFYWWICIILRRVRLFSRVVWLGKGQFQWSIGTNRTIGTNRKCCFARLTYRTRNIHNNYSALLLGIKANLSLHGWLIGRGIFIIIISAFLLGVKENLFCTNRTIGIGCFSIGANRTIGTNGPLELPCTQADHIRK